MKKIISILVVFLICVSIFPANSFQTNAWDAQNYWSRANDKFNKGYLPLLGFGSTDMVRIATNQNSYSASHFGYPGAWCAAFVSDCAYLAGQSKAIPFDPTCSSLLSKVLEHGGQKVSAPKEGDLIFYYCTTAQRWCHVAIMKDATFSVHGNCAGRVYDNLKYNSYVDTCGKCYTVTFVRPNYNNNVDYNIETKCDMKLQTAQKDVIVRNGPYKKNNEVYRINDIGTIVRVVAYTLNSYNHIWYKLDDGNWIYSERLQPVSKYTITYNANGGSNAPSNQTKTKDKPIVLSSTYPSKKMRVFIGWSTDSRIKSTYYDENEALTKVNYQPGATYTANKKLNLYAVWVEAKTSLSLSKTVTTLDVDDNKTTTINLEIKGAINSGYTVSVSPSNNVTVKASSISVSTISKLGTLANLKLGTGKATVTLTAKEKGNGTTIIYIKDNKGKVVATGGISVNVTKKFYITYDANKGTGAPTKQTRISGKNAYISSTVPTMKNYTFMGWMVSGSEEVKYGPGDIYNLDQDITLVAKWDANNFTEPILSSDGKTLTIVGNGDMPNYGENNYSSSDWYKWASTVETIKFQSANGGTITSIGSYAFANFKKLQTVEVPSSIKRIYSYAFYNCISLQTVTAPADVTLGSYAFANCGSLKNYTTKTSPKRATATFALNSVDEEDGSIGAFAFENCVNLQSIDISDVNYIGESAFSGCTSLNNIELSDNLTKIEDAAFFNCSDLTEIVLPESLTEIDDGAFSGCSALSDITLPENLEVLGAETFSGCSEITGVIIPDSVEEIGEAVFANCTSLEDVVLPEDIACLSDSMFSGCSVLQNIDIPENTLDLGEGTFFGCTSLEDINIPENVGEIGNNTFAYCESLSKVDIPDSVQNIESFAFFGCSNLENIKLSSQIDKIGSAAFAMCSSLSEISFPASLTEIGEAAFAECTALSKIDFEEAMVKINDEAFVGCLSLSDVTIPECATYVSSTAFSNCSSAFTVSCYSTSDVYETIDEMDIPYNVIKPVQGMRLDKESVSLKKGETIELNAVFTPSDATNKNVIWASQDEEIASVSDTGVVTALGSGTAVIIATSKEGNYEARCEINCTVPVESITVLDDWNEYYVGTEMSISYGFNPERPTNIDVNFISSNENIASVSDDGILSINKPGTAVITLASNDGNTSTSFVVNAVEYIPVNYIEINCERINLALGDTFELNATAYPSNATSKEICFYSEDESIASVNEYGLISAKGLGSTSIVCVSDEYEVTCEITVSSQNPCLNGNHQYTIIVTPPTCESEGYTTHTCAVCKDRYTDSVVKALGHFDNDNDGNCDRCGEKTGEPVNPPKPNDPAENCSCACHKKGVANFFFKILLFFQKIFKKNKVCSCGAMHY